MKVRLVTLYLLRANLRALVFSFKYNALSFFNSITALTIFAGVISINRPTLSSTASGKAPLFEAITGVPQAKASITTRPKPS